MLIIEHEAPEGNSIEMYKWIEMGCYDHIHYIFGKRETGDVDILYVHEVPWAVIVVFGLLHHFQSMSPNKPISFRMIGEYIRSVISSEESSF